MVGVSEAVEALESRIRSHTPASTQEAGFSRESPELEVSEPEFPTTVELAYALMERIPALKCVRLRLVPSVFPEDEFWARYFSILRVVIIGTFTNS